jgi:hypothetical protein
MEAASRVIDAYLAELGASARALAPGEWGLTTDIDGGSLDVGLALRGGVLRAQAWVASPGRIDLHRLLRWNRGRAFARFTHSAAGDVHVEATLPVDGVTAPALDRLLGDLVAAAGDARAAARG